MSEIESFFEAADEDYDVTEAETSSKSEKKKKSRRSKILIAILIIVLLLGLGVAGAFIWANRALEETHRLDLDMSSFTHEPEVQSSGTTFLLLGSDSRISNGSISWQKGAQRSDVIMLAQLSEDGKHLTIMSIPRDTAVVIPGYENNRETKLNHSFSYGGVPLLVSTLEKNTGIRIDHVAVMDFQSFVGLTDAVGGVTLSSESGGTKTYTGQEALSFVRERKHLPRGDFDRVRRQQAWMAAIFDKVLSREVLTSPSKTKEVYDNLIPYVAFDDSFGVSQTLGFANSIKSLDKSSIQFATVPTNNSGLNAAGNWLTHFDPAHFEPLCEAWQKGEAWKYVDEHPEAFDRLGSRPVA